MRSKVRPHTPSGGDDPHTLAVDVGGTGLKASVLDRAGNMMIERVRVATPYPCYPATLLDAIVGLAAKLPTFDRVSVGFPGVVRAGRVLTAPHFQSEAWSDYRLEDALAHRLGKPTRLANDAEVQGLGVIARRGLELVLTLGTGAGTALFCNGRPTPHLELAQHPIHKRKTYNDYIGDKTRRRLGNKRWNRHVRATIDILFSLLHYDTLYLGGGNAVHVTFDLSDNVRIVSNDAGITGGVRLWDVDFAHSAPKQV